MKYNSHWIFDSMEIESYYLNQKTIIQYYVQYNSICGKIHF